MIDLLRQFIAFRTTADNPEAKHACLDWIQENFFGDVRLPIERGEVGSSPYLLINHPDPQLLWFAHFDVVPGNEEQFRLQIEGDHALGRGVKDMKGAALPFLMAYRDALREGQQPRVSILLTSDEETAGPTIPQLLEGEKLDVPVVFTPDTGMAPHIVVEHKGVVWADLYAKGKGSHAAAPWESENPIFLLSEALSRIAEAFPPGTYDDWQITVTPAQLSGSTARNQIPDEAWCALDIRYPPTKCSSATDAIANVSACLPEGCSITEHLSAAPLSTDSEHPMVKSLQSHAQEIIGEDVPIGREHGATDARYFGERGIPAFLYGPLGGGLHANDEWVSIPSLEHQYELGTRMLADLS